MVDANADPAGIGGEIADPVGHRPTKPLDQEIMRSHFLGIALRAPLPAAILEVAHQLLLLRIHRYHRLLLDQSTADACVDVGELRISIRMTAALTGLAIGLQTELLSLEQFAHDGMADLVPDRAQRVGQAAQAFAGPAQGRHRIATLARVDQRQQILQQRRVRRSQSFAATTNTAIAINRYRRRASQF